MSELKNIAAALVAAQQEMGKAFKDANNPFFNSKYADLSSVMGACLPALNKNGIAVIQPQVYIDNEDFVKTVFLHTSGETLETAVRLKVDKENMQGLGSAITYARRYGLMELAGLTPEDDDGNAAAAAPRKQAPKKEHTKPTERPQDAKLPDYFTSAGWKATVGDLNPQELNALITICDEKDIYPELATAARACVLAK